jgi:MFS family permease
VASQAEAVSGGRPGRAVPSGGQALALATLCTVLFLTFLDNTVVSVALGDIQVSLKANVSDLQWVVGAYALTFASIMLACGMIGDELGRKKVMLAGVGVFCAGSVLCALAPNVQTLIAGRAVMGLGAAASEPGTLSMLRHLYPDARTRNRAIGIWAATSGFALAAGPVVGGVLTGVWSWRGIFWFNLAFGLAALIVAAVILPESADPTASRVDTAGTILGAGALATFVFAIIDAESAGFGSPVVIILLCLSAVLFAAFGWWERRAPNPLLDLRYLRVPQFTTANITAFCTYFATFAIFFFTALYLVEVVNTSGYRLALIFLPMTLLMIGAVTGVAVLGSLVYSQLHVSLVAQMNHLGVPKSFQGLVINAIETGQIPQNTSAYAGFGKLVQEVIGAAYQAFHDGLHAALYLSAGLVLAAGLLSFITLRSRPISSGS